MDLHVLGIVFAVVGAMVLMMEWCRLAFSGGKRTENRRNPEGVDRPTGTQRDQRPGRRPGGDGARAADRRGTVDPEFCAGRAGELRAFDATRVVQGRADLPFAKYKDPGGQRGGA